MNIYYEQILFICFLVSLDLPGEGFTIDQVNASHSKWQRGLFLNYLYGQLCQTTELLRHKKEHMFNVYSLEYECVLLQH